jgi:nitroreductase
MGHRESTTPAAEEKKMAAEKQLWSAMQVPASNVSVYEALYKRRSAWKFKDTPVSKATMQKILGPAIWAPNHRNNEPWRFVAIAKDSPLRAKIADAVVAALTEEWQDAKRAAPYGAKVTDPAYIVFCYYVGAPDAFVDKENYAALLLAIQNMALAGYAEGLSVTIDTGRTTRVPAVDGLVGAGEGWKMTAMLAVGVPDEDSKSARTPVGEFVTWL